MNGRYWGSRKSEWALQRGGRSAHPFSWLLSSPQQPLETEDPPTVSLAPQYTSQHLCRAIEIFSCSKNPRKIAIIGQIQASSGPRECKSFIVLSVKDSRSGG